MDRFFTFSVFVKVVELGSFARAADRLDISTSACSRYVAELETHLGSRLLNRTTRRLSLTESGQTFYERCVQLLTDLDEAESSAASGTIQPRGTLRLTCAVNFGVHHIAPAVSAFLAQYPDIKCAVSLSDHIEDLAEEGFDLAIRIGELGSQNLIARKLGESCSVLCASPGYLKKHGTPKKPSDLAKHNCLLYEYLSARDQWQFNDRYGKPHTVRVSGSLHANNGDLLTAAAVHGTGIILEPDFYVAALLKSGKLVRLLGRYQTRSIPIYVVYLSRRHLSAKVRVFVDFIAAHFARRGE